MTIGYIYLSGMIILTTISQYFIKKGALKIKTNKGIKVLLLSFFKKKLVIGGLLTIIAPLLYIAALETIPLSIAFFFTSLNIISIALTGKYFLNETINKKQWGGILLIVFGIIILGL